MNVVVVVVEEVDVAAVRTVSEAMADLFPTVAVTGTTPVASGGTENDVENFPLASVRKVATAFRLSTIVPLLRAGNDLPDALTVAPTAAEVGERSKTGPATASDADKPDISAISTTKVTVLETKSRLIGVPSVRFPCGKDGFVDARSVCSAAPGGGRTLFLGVVEGSLEENNSSEHHRRREPGQRLGQTLTPSGRACGS